MTFGNMSQKLWPKRALQADQKNSLFSDIKI